MPRVWCTVLVTVCVVVAAVCCGWADGASYDGNVGLFMDRLAGANLAGLSGLAEPLQLRSFVADDGSEYVAVVGSCEGQFGLICAATCKYEGSEGVKCPLPAVDIMTPAGLAYNASDFVIEVDDSNLFGSLLIVAAELKQLPSNNPIVGVLLANLTAAGPVYHASFPVCVAAGCAREPSINVEFGNILVAVNDFAPKVYLFDYDGTEISSADMTTGSGPGNSQLNTGLHPKLEARSTGAGAVVSHWNVGAGMLRICVWEFTFSSSSIFATVNQCAGAFPGPVARASKPVWSSWASAWKTALAFPNGTVASATAMGGFLTIAPLPGVPIFPPPPGPAPPMAPPPVWKVFLGFVPTKGSTAALVIAFSGQNAFGYLFNEPITMLEHSISMLDLPGGVRMYDSLTLGGGPNLWSGGLLLGFSVITGDVEAVVISFVPSNVPGITPATQTGTAAPWGSTHPFAVSSLTSQLMFTDESDGAAVLDWIRYRGSRIEFLIAGGSSPCDTFSIDCTVIPCTSTPLANGQLVMMLSGAAFETDTSGPNFVIKVTDNSATSSDIQVLMNGIKYECLVDGGVFPVSHTLAFSIQVRSGRGGYSNFADVATSPTATDVELFDPIFNGSTFGSDWGISTTGNVFMNVDSFALYDPSVRAVTRPATVANSAWNAMKFYAELTTSAAGDDLFLIDGEFDIVSSSQDVIQARVEYSGAGGDFYVYPTSQARPAMTQVSVSEISGTNGIEISINDGSADVMTAVLRALRVTLGAETTTTTVKLWFVYETQLPARRNDLGSLSITRSSDTGPPGPVVATCGDGIVFVGDAENAREDCDDGNVSSGDGCSDVCVVEAGWSCVLAPLPDTRSVCTRGVAPRPTEQKSDLFEVETDPASSSTAWTGYVIALVILALLAVTVYKRTMNNSDLPENYVRASFFVKLVRDHSLVGICFVHGSDPFSRFPRLVSLLLQLNITYATSVVILILFSGEEGSIMGFVLSAIVASVLSFLCGSSLLTSLIRSGSPKKMAIGRAGGTLLASFLTAVNGFVIFGNALIFPDALVDYHQSVLVAFTAGLFTDFALVEPLMILIKAFMWSENHVYQASGLGTYKPNAVGAMTPPKEDTVPMDALGAGGGAGAGVPMFVMPVKTKAANPVQRQATPAPASFTGADGGGQVAGGGGGGVGAAAAFVAPPAHATSANRSPRHRPQTKAPSATALAPPPSTAPLRRSATADNETMGTGRALTAGPPPGSANIDTFVFNR